VSYRSAVTFMPSAASYGAEDVDVSTETTDSGKSGKGITEFIPAIKAVLGLDDPAKRAAQIRTQIAVIDGGGPAAFAQAKAVCVLCSLPEARQKLVEELETAESEAYKARTRDTLYTALAVTGVVVGSMGAIWLGTKVWTQLQVGRKVQAETKRITGS